MKQKICVLGGGAWGTAVSTLLAHNGHDVKLWCFEPKIAHAISKDRCNERYLPGIQLDERIQAVTELQRALSDVTWVFEAIPVTFLRTVVQQCKPFFSPQQIWVVLSKGIENDTLLFPTQIIDDVFRTTVCTAVVSGPSFAKELAQNKMTAVTVATTDPPVGTELQEMLACDYFRPYRSDDPLGTQLGGALKNVLTLGIGMLDGAGFGDNTKALLLTTGLKEMVSCARALGAKEQTIYGLSGVGDVVLSSMSVLSRNLVVGKRLGSGQSLERALEETGFIPEGINTVKSVHKLADREGVKLPILGGLYQVIFGDKTIEGLLQELMAHPLEVE